MSVIPLKLQHCPWGVRFKDNIEKTIAISDVIGIRGRAIVKAVSVTAEFERGLYGLNVIIDDVAPPHTKAQEKQRQPLQCPLPLDAILPITEKQSPASLLC